MPKKLVIWYSDRKGRRRRARRESSAYERRVYSRKERRKFKRGITGKLRKLFG